MHDSQAERKNVITILFWSMFTEKSSKVWNESKVSVMFLYRRNSLLKYQRETELKGPVKYVKIKEKKRNQNRKKRKYLAPYIWILFSVCEVYKSQIYHPKIFPSSCEEKQIEKGSKPS